MCFTKLADHVEEHLPSTSSDGLKISLEKNGVIHCEAIGQKTESISMSNVLLDTADEYSLLSACLDKKVHCKRKTYIELGKKAVIRGRARSQKKVDFCSKSELGSKCTLHSTVSSGVVRCSSNGSKKDEIYFTALDGHKCSCGFQYTILNYSKLI
jgi:hypothetical protein